MDDQYSKSIYLQVQTLFIYLYHLLMWRVLKIKYKIHDNLFFISQINLYMRKNIKNKIYGNLYTASLSLRIIHRIGRCRTVLKLTWN